ncbi:PhzF family phenazine biosynthesis protein [Bacillus sp. dmp10]|nr:PhzF family phenazine biosynthesis protein [Bacillus sp. dmp10]
MNCYDVVTFTDTVFKGNPIAVCVMENWIPNTLMQQIAIESLSLLN